MRRVGSGPMRLIGAVILAASVAGCSLGPADGETASSGSNGSAQSARQAGVNPAELEDPIASVDAPISLDNDPEATLKIDVYELRREGELLYLTASFTPTNRLAESQRLFDLLGSQSWSPTLIDPMNLTRYSVVTASGSLKSNDTGVEAVSGEQRFVYAIFAAPPEHVDALDVIFAEGVPMMSQVPLS